MCYIYFYKIYVSQCSLAMPGYDANKQHKQSEHLTRCWHRICSKIKSDHMACINTPDTLNVPVAVVCILKLIGSKGDWSSFEFVSINCLQYLYVFKHTPCDNYGFFSSTGIGVLLMSPSYCKRLNLFRFCPWEVKK